MCVRCAKRLVILVTTDLALSHLYHPLPKRIDFRSASLPTLAAIRTNSRRAAMGSTVSREAHESAL